MRAIKARVAVIGGGLSGLAAARRLIAGGVDDVVVLEAKPRVGGRLLDQSVGLDQYVEGGGEWAGHDHEHVRELAAAVGVSQYEPFVAGDSVLESGGEVVRYSGPVPPLSAQAVAALCRAGDHIDELAARVPAASPWTAPTAAELDSRTLSSWLDTTFPEPQARAAMEVRMTLAFALPTERISLLHAAGFFAGVGGWKGYQGRLALRFSSGAQHLASAVAAELGDRVHLATPVRLVDHQSDDLVAVRCDELSLEVAAVVVAMSPADCRTIAFAPGLPPARAMLHNSWQAGAQLKVHAVYETPFWRESGLAGSSFSLTAAPYMTFDNTPESGSPGVLGALLTYDAGPLPAEAQVFCLQNTKHGAPTCLMRWPGVSDHKPRRRSGTSRSRGSTSRSTPVRLSGTAKALDRGRPRDQRASGPSALGFNRDGRPLGRMDGGRRHLRAPRG